MKIAFIVGQFPALSVTFILNQITGLIDRGHEVDIYADERGESEKLHPSIEAYRLLDRTYYLPRVPTNLATRALNGVGLLAYILLRDPEVAWRSLNAFKYGKQAISLWLLYTGIPSFKKSYDIIHCQFGTQSYRGISFKTINSPKAKLIVNFRGHDISSFVQEKGDKIYDEVFKISDFFLVNCDFFRQKAIKLGCDSDKIVVHRSGLDCSKFIFTPRYPSPDGWVRVVTTGRLVDKKGIEYAIRAVAKQALDRHKVEYTIIGDGPLKEKFQNLIQELNISHFVKLVGWKNEREIIEILNRSHIFIAPSVTAQNGDRDAPTNVLKEAMAMGLPVISTVHGGIPELVEDGVSGFLVPERDVEALAEKLGYLIEHPEVWATMGQAGRDYVEKHYNLTHLNDRLIELYQQLLNSDKLNSDASVDRKSIDYINNH
ncbi:glycosyltransferase [Chamaesiphon polymorphus]|uniref:Colanic acid biosynthesis glycosyltransferase WcaL n=1 Tax=Chamaesiphon polymorphus CCALA 037 TaxID=2107692 RepID=A0A2T1GME4_9CYAN|nr:glycosyltransferase [Chamaesiphon polymorphus]PSB58980.1 colanic acid biosynthesis glycosyltransferase WcaL [Chamaesiphon polymorphus CCALA 037]